MVQKTAGVRDHVAKHEMQGSTSIMLPNANEGFTRPDYERLPESEYETLSQSEQSSNNRNQTRSVNTALLISVSVFVLLLVLQHTVADYLAPSATEKGKLESRLAAARCLAVFSLAVLLWATGAVPLFVTALAIPPLTVCTQVYLSDAGLPKVASAAADDALRAMGDDAVFMVLGVYVLGAALQKTSFVNILQRTVYAVATKPLLLQAAVMVSSILISAVVSNVFAPVLLLSVLEPLFHQLGHDRRPLALSLISGVSVASNIGGMPSPIASPQNIVAHALIREVSFSEWVKITAPQCSVMVLIGYIFLVLRYKTYRYRILPQDIANVPRNAVRFSRTDFFVLSSFAVTIVLWVTPWGNQWFGHPGVVALIAVVTLFGEEVLSLDDFKRLPWNTVWLVAGGVVLGRAIQSSQLLHFVGLKFEHALESSSTWVAFWLVVIFLSAVAQGISHTVSAIIVLPLVEKIGTALGHPKLLVMGGVLACSSAMMLPVSSFPNMSACGVLDIDGVAYISPGELLAIGLPMTIACGGVVGTVGFTVMTRLWNTVS